MNYVYPKLSARDFMLFRLGGAGLGNILFTYARAVVFAQKNDCRVIWPTWMSVRLRPILRHEKDKRFYHNLFANNSGYIDGLKKIRILLTKRKISEQEAEENAANGKKFDHTVVVFRGFEDCFAPILYDSPTVLTDILKNLKKKNRKALSFSPDGAVCVHVRLGDFYRVPPDEVQAGKHNSAIPIEWYVRMVEEIRRISGTATKVYVFSDGCDEELEPLLRIENVERKSFGSAIADIIALSRAGLFIASGSSFSMWARYLGRMTTVMYPNQVKQEILTDEDPGKEIVALEKIPSEYRDAIKAALNGEDNQKN